MAPDNIKEMLHGCWGDMFRVKTPRYLPEDAALSTIYKRHAILDLFNAGLYSVLAVGIFSLSGIVVKDFAGPSAILSVFVAALAIVCTGKCDSHSYALIILAPFVYSEELILYFDNLVSDCYCQTPN